MCLCDLHQCCRQWLTCGHRPAGAEAQTDAKAGLLFGVFDCKPENQPGVLWAAICLGDTHAATEAGPFRVKRGEYTVAGLAL